LTIFLISAAQETIITARTGTGYPAASGLLASFGSAKAVIIFEIALGLDPSAGPFRFQASEESSGSGPDTTNGLPSAFVWAHFVPARGPTR
jgi:hypothetical protein